MDYNEEGKAVEDGLEEVEGGELSEIVAAASSRDSCSKKQTAVGPVCAAPVYIVAMAESSAQRCFTISAKIMANDFILQSFSNFKFFQPLIRSF